MSDDKHEEHEIPVRLKPQRPTFVDGSPKEGSVGEAATGMARGCSVSTMDSDMNEKPTTKPTEPTNHPKPEPIDSVDTERLMEYTLDELTSLKELQQAETMAMFKLLVEDLLTVTELNKQGELDLGKLLFGSMGEQLMSKHIVNNPEHLRLSEELSVEEDAGHPDGDETTETPDTGSKGEDIWKMESLRQYPVLLQEVVASVEAKRSASREEDLRKFKSRSNEELEINFRKKSKIDHNFGELSVKPLEVEQIREVAGSYSQNMDQELCLNIARRFYLKKEPKLSVTTYLERINRFLSPSPAVVLTASYFLFNVAFNLRAENDNCVLPLQEPEEPIQLTPVEPLDVFRLVLSVIRISLKLIEDKNFKQAYYCKITGLQNVQDLFRLELSYLYLLEFNLFINEYILIRFLYQFRVFHRNLTKHIASRASSTEHSEPPTETAPDSLAGTLQ